MAGAYWLRGARIANAHADVTPSDTEDSTTVLPPTTVALYVGGAGTLTAEMWGGTAEVQYTVGAGSYLEGNFKYVKATGTGATLIKVLYVNPSA